MRLLLTIPNIKKTFCRSLAVLLIIALIMQTFLIPGLLLANTSDTETDASSITTIPAVSGGGVYPMSTSGGAGAESVSGESIKTYAQGLAFGQVDPASGVYSASSKEVELLNPYGNNLSVVRSYSSSGFKVSPKWNDFTGNPEYYAYGWGDEAQWQPTQIKQNGGYMGAGWKIENFGRLEYYHYYNQSFVTIQLGSQTLRFQTASGDPDGTYTNMILGNHATLSNYYSSGTFLLLLEDGTSYWFNKSDRYYFKYMNYIWDDRNGSDPTVTRAYYSSLYNLSYIQPADYGGNIYFEYETSTKVADTTTNSRYNYQVWHWDFWPVGHWEDDYWITMEDEIFVYRSRPIRMYNDVGQNIVFSYRSEWDDTTTADSMVSGVSWLDESGVTQSVTYGYEDDLLTSATYPNGQSTQYTYAVLSDGDGTMGSYSYAGNLLQNITNTLGAQSTVYYQWKSPTDFSTTFTASENEQMASWVVKKNTVSDETNTFTTQYAYSDGATYNIFSDDSSSGAAWSFTNVTVTDPGSNNTELHFANGLPTYSNDPLGNTMTQVNDSTVRQPTSRTTLKGGSYTVSETMAYDAYGNVTSYSGSGSTGSPIDTTTSYYYNQDSRYLSNDMVHFPYQNTLTVSGDLYSTYTIYDAGYRGNVDYAYKESVVTGLTHVSPVKQTSVYTSGGLPSTITDALGNYVQFTYSLASGATEWSIAKTLYNSSGVAKQSSTQYFYPHTGRLKKVTDANGGSTQMTYDSMGRTLTKIFPNGTTETYSYDDTAHTVTATDPNANQTTVAFNALGQKSSITRPTGLASESYTYDWRGKVSTKTVSNGSQSLSTTYAYDSLGRVSSITQKTDGTQVSVMTYSYADATNKVSVTDNGGKTTVLTYDWQNNLTNVLMPNGKSASYSYDARKLLQGITDMRSLATSKTYDYFSRPSGTSFANGTAVAFNTYDDMDNLTAMTDANSQAFAYTYDYANRVSALAVDSSTKETYVYDSATNGVGKLASVSNANAATAYTYDTMGRVTNESKTIGSTAYATQFGYDNKGNLTTLTLPNSKAIGYTYDAGDRVSTVSAQINGAATNIVSYAYNPIGTVSTVAFGNGVNITYSYNNKNLVESFSISDPNGSALKAEAFTYDDAGNVQTMTRQQIATTNTETLTYTYDDVYQLTGVSYSDGASQGFAYDDNGNRTTHSHDAGTDTFTIATDSDQLSSYASNIGVVNISHDNNGNMTQKVTALASTTTGTESLTYDYAGHLTKFTFKDGTFETYDYDSYGNMIRKTDRHSSVTLYHYIAGQIVAEGTEAGTINKIYVWANGQKVARVDVDSDGTEHIYYLHNNVLGSTVAITNSSGQQLQEFMWGPFGELEYNGGAHVTDEINFTGKIYNEDTGLMYFGARFYDPQLGRFITEDHANPKFDKPYTLNRYAYGLNSPMMYVDPDGNFVFFAFLGAIIGGAVNGAIAGAISGAVMGAANWAISGGAHGNFWESVGGGALKGAASGALVGGVMSGVGYVGENVGNLLGGKGFVDNAEYVNNVAGGNIASREWDGDLSFDGGGGQNMGQVADYWGSPAGNQGADVTKLNDFQRQQALDFRDTLNKGIDIVNDNSRYVNYLSYGVIFGARYVPALIPAVPWALNWLEFNDKFPEGLDQIIPRI